MNTPSSGAPSSGAGHALTRSSCLGNRHRQNQWRKRGPAARAVAVAFAPALDLIVTATTAVTIGWEVGEACVRISPAIAVSPGVSPGEARRSRRRRRTGKTRAGNRHCRVFSDVPHEVDPLRGRIRESNLTFKTRFRSSSAPARAEGTRLSAARQEATALNLVRQTVPRAATTDPQFLRPPWRLRNLSPSWAARYRDCGAGSVSGHSGEIER
jgi:hypothetical protein